MKLSMSVFIDNLCDKSWIEYNAGRKFLLKYIFLTYKK